MYKLTDFGQAAPPFMELLLSKWNKIHTELEVFRYKVGNEQSRIIDAKIGKYVLKLNPNRSTKRRAPEEINNICQPFNDKNFNFTKVNKNEILFSIDSDANEHDLIVNVSPISRYHTLLCPSVNKKFPQVVTAESLSLVLDIIFVAGDGNLKIGFNSLCALASVNHLHYHLIIENHTLPVEVTKWQHIQGPLFYTPDYIVPAFCFEVERNNTDCKEIYKLIQYMLQNSIAHNILVTKKSDKAAVYIWPRKSTAGAKQLTNFNTAVLELGGFFTVYSEEAFQNLKLKDLEVELSRWKLDNFEKLCKDVKQLYPCFNFC